MEHNIIEKKMSADVREAEVELSNDRQPSNGNRTNGSQLPLNENWYSVLQSVVEATASVTDEDFFVALVKNLVKVTGVTAAFITEYLPEERQARTIALSVRGEIHQNMQFEVIDSPCGVVIDREQVCIYHEKLKAKFPHRENVIGVDAESYIGIPYFDSDNRLRGYLALVDERPMTNTGYLVTIGKLFASRAAVELERSHTLQALQHRMEIEKLLAEISASYVNIQPEDLDATINRSLSALGVFAAVDRCYIFQFSGDKSTFSNTYEWCAPGIVSRRQHLQSQPVSELCWNLDVVQTHEVLYVPDLDDLPESAVRLRNFLTEHQIASLLEVPLIAGGELLGILGFNSSKRHPSWPKEDIRMLKMAGETFVNALERQRTESQLRKAHKQMLQSEKMAVLGKLTAGIAHEVNSPLGAVKCSADTMARCVEKLTESLHGMLSDEQRESSRLDKTLKVFIDSINLITDASSRISGLVSNLKSFATMDESDMQTINLHEAIEGTLVLLRHRVPSRIRILKDYATLESIVCRPAEIQQVMMAIISNAIEAIADKGSITIKTYAGHNKQLIEISDTGCGMETEKLQRLFALDFRTKSQRVGVGLGLFSSYSIIQKHQGDLRIESSPGQGTTVTIELPVSAEEQ